MKTQQDMLDKIGETETTVDNTGTVNQGIVDDLDAQLDTANAASDRTAEIDALEAVRLNAAKTVTSTHSPAPAPKA